MANSVLIIGVDYKEIDRVARAVSEKVDKMFLSMHDLIIYEMQGLVGDIDNIDKDYVNERINEVKLGALEYEDSIISVDITNINNEKFEKAITKLPKIYVQKEKTNNVFGVVYEDRDNILKSLANFVVKNQDFEAQVEEVVEIIKKIGDKLWNNVLMR